MVHICYLRLHLGTATVSCRLFATDWIETWRSEPTFSSLMLCQQKITKKYKKSLCDIFLISLADHFMYVRRYWVNHFSTDLIWNSDILVTWLILWTQKEVALNGLAYFNQTSLTFLIEDLTHVFNSLQLQSWFLEAECQIFSKARRKSGTE